MAFVLNQKVVDRGSLKEIPTRRVDIDHHIVLGSDTAEDAGHFLGREPFPEIIRTDHVKDVDHIVISLGLDHGLVPAREDSVINPALGIKLCRAEPGQL